MKGCFVISPIGPDDSEIREHSDLVLKEIIQPAVTECGLSAQRSDEWNKSGRITDQMFEAILQKDFCIAVLTGSNPNVFYELGVAQAAGKAVIMLMEEGVKLPFDIQDFRTISYSLDPAKQDAARKKLVGQIGELKASNWASEGLLERYRRKTKHDAYFVLFPSLRGDPFYLELLAGISSNPVPGKDMTFVGPNHAYSGPQFLEALDALQKRQSEFVAGLIAPTLRDISVEELTTHISRFEIPLVLVDINPYRESALPARICYVGFDNRSGGREAARAMTKAIGNGRVLVLGNDDQPDRQQGFLDVWNGGTLPVLESCEFDRALARATTTRMMSGSTAQFQGIFAVSDEIALGAVQAVSHMKRPPVVIGFDGTSAATLLIDLKNKILINTVLQNPYNLGVKAIAILKQQMASEPVSKQTEILSVRMYKSEPS